MIPAPAAGPREFRAILWRSVVVPVVAMTLAALLLSWAVGRLLRDAASVQRADEIIGQANAALKLAVDMETGLRGYQLTGRSELLEPYENASDQIEAAFTRLAASADLLPEQHATLRELATTRQAWRAFAEETIRRKTAGEDVASYALNARGKELFDAFRSAFARFVGAEERQKDERSIALAQFDRRLLQSRFALLIALGAGMGWFILAQVARVARMFQNSEAIARARAEMLHVTLKSIGDGVIATDAAGRITFLNPPALAATGWNEAEAIGEPLERVFAVVHEETRERLPNPAAEVLRSRTAVELPDRAVLIAKDGREIAVADSAAPIVAGPQGVTGVILVFHDVTRERSADVARAQLAAIVESSVEAIIAQRLDGTIYEWNRGAEKLFGYSAREMVGQSILRLTSPERSSEMLETLRRTQAGESTVGVNTARRRKDGSVVQVSVSVSPIRDTTGKVIAGAMIVHDTTELTRTLAELQAAQESLLVAQSELERKVEERTRELSVALEKAQEVDRLKSEFLATMSHELRTPLNSIIGFTELVIAGIPGPINDEQKRQLGMAHNSARHLLHLINDLLDLARIESGRVEPTWEAFSPAEVIREALETMQPMASRRAVKIVTDLSLPATLCSDRKMFLQILLNLLTNAVKFTERGQIALSCKPDGDWLVSRIADTGIGIKPEQMGLLFEAFRQVDGTSRRRYEGTGLGLYLCRRLVTILGGEIHAESVFGTGSTFTFSVPLTHRHCS